jgi:hypothetical protein
MQLNDIVATTVRKDCRKVHPRVFGSYIVPSKLYIVYIVSYKLNSYRNTTCNIKQFLYFVSHISFVVPSYHIQLTFKRKVPLLVYILFVFIHIMN